MDNEKCLAFIILKTMLILIAIVIVTVALIYCILICKLFPNLKGKNDDKNKKKSMSVFKKMPVISSRSTSSNFSWNTTWDTSSNLSQTTVSLNPPALPKSKVISSSEGSGISNFSWNTSWETESSTNTALISKNDNNKISKIQTN